MIESILISIAILGVILFVILGIQIKAVRAEYSLKKHRSKESGVSDLLIYSAVVDDGVIVCKNGSFMAAWIYKGEDTASSTDDDRNLLSFRINQALSRLGSGWMIHVDAIRRPAPSYSIRGASFFPDRLSAAIDEERRQLFEHLGSLYEGFFILTITWYPPKLVQRKIVEMMFDDESATSTSRQKTLNLINQFKLQIDNVESKLSSAISMERLKSETFETEAGDVITHDHFLSWLQFCITGINQPIVLPKTPVYLDQLLGGQELWPGVTPKLGRKFIQCVAIEGFPFDSYPGILNSLSELAVEYRWSSRYVFLDRHEALSQLEDYRKKWKQKIRGFMDQIFRTGGDNINEDAQNMVSDASGALADTNSGLVCQGLYTSVVVLMGEERNSLEAAAQRIEKTIENLGFTSRVETINTMDAFLGSLPGHGVENLRRPVINSMNLADLLPTSSIWTGENRAPSPMYPPLSPPLMHCVTSGNSPFRLNLHVRDLGHTAMFGPTRAGKSTHLGILALQFRRYKGSRIFTFDKGLSMYPVCKSVGGSHYDVGGDDDKLAFAPLSYLSSKSDRAWAMEWIDTILALNGVITEPPQRNAIANAIDSMAESGSKTLSEFSVTIQDESIRQAILQYTIDGSLGNLLDAEEDGLSLSDFMTFELENIMQYGDKYCLPVLLYLFRRIERSLDGNPTFIILDEAWLMLAHPVFKQRIKMWLKTLAKLNCFVLMATQNLSDAVNSGIIDTIVESTATKIFLPNSSARTEKNIPFYEEMGLNSKQIDIVASAIPKRDYYYVSEKGRRLYSLALGPLALAIVGKTDPESIKTVQNLVKEFGDDWLPEWLKINNIDLSEFEGAA